MQSKITSLSNKWHFYALLLALIGLSFVSLYFLIVLIPYILYLRHLRLLTIKVTLIFIIFSSALLFLFLYSPPLTPNLSGTIVNIEEYADYKALTLDIGIKKVLVYYRGTTNLVVGDKINISGTPTNLSNSNYDLYLKSKLIFQTFSANKVQIIGHRFTIESLRINILDWYKKILKPNSYNFLSSLVYSLDSFDDTFTTSVNSIGISYLFCISGFHITMLTIVLEKLLSKNMTLYLKRDYIIGAFLVLYTLLCGTPYGVLRASLMYILTRINFNKQLNLTKLDIVSLAFLIIGLSNPLALFRMSFRLTFIVTFFIILGSYLINDKSKLKGAYKMAILAFLVSIPLVSSISNEINFITIAISPIFLSIFSIIIMPLVYILAIVPYLSGFIEPIFILFTRLIYLTDSITFLKFTIASFSPIMIILYYLVLIMIYIKVETKKLKISHILMLIAIFIVMLNKPTFDNVDKVIMLDVGQGDSILIKRKHNKGNILIDSYNDNLSKLKALGIKRIDILIITHSDNDHIETASDVIERFNCQTLISSIYDSGDEIVSLRKEVTTNYLFKMGDSFSFKDINLEFLGPVREDININNNSLVFFLSINKTKILFTGDMEEREEEDISRNYNKLIFDILKVPHHGSNTSLSESLFNKLVFNEAIISVGKNNRYNHPSIETINKLKNHLVYQTKDRGDIYIFISNNNYKIKTNINLNPFFIT